MTPEYIAIHPQITLQTPLLESGTFFYRNSDESFIPYRDHPSQEQNSIRVLIESQRPWVWIRQEQVGPLVEEIFAYFDEHRPSPSDIYILALLISIRPGMTGEEITEFDKKLSSRLIQSPIALKGLFSPGNFFVFELNLILKLKMSYEIARYFEWCGQSTLRKLTLALLNAHQTLNHQQKHDLLVQKIIGRSPMDFVSIHAEDAQRFLDLQSEKDIAEVISHQNLFFVSDWPWFQIEKQLICSNLSVISNVADWVCFKSFTGNSPGILQDIEIEHLKSQLQKTSFPGVIEAVQTLSREQKHL